MKQFIENLKETFEIEDREVLSEDNYKEYEEWDSLAYLGLLAMVKEEYDITLSSKEVDSALTVKQLFDLINSKNI